MRVLYANHPDQGLSQAINHLIAYGVPNESRNGPVLRFPTPVTTVWTEPTHRVSVSHVRDANPFLHLMEAMWMLAGRNDVETVSYYAKQMAEYSDDGKTLNAAYGYRWRKHFGHDQLDEVVEILKKDPASRQAVVQIWDHQDLVSSTKDRACNTQVLFEIQSGSLNMTVFNRSNDTIWGCYGANVVHFSFLQEYMANRIGVDVGVYYQVSNNLHLYTEFEISQRYIVPSETPGPIRSLVYDTLFVKPLHNYRARQGALAWINCYRSSDSHVRSSDFHVTPLSLNAQAPGFEEELQEIVSNFKNSRRLVYKSQFLNEVAEPMRVAYTEWKAGNKNSARDIIGEQSLVLKERDGTWNDWLDAGKRWMDRRIARA